MIIHVIETLVSACLSQCKEMEETCLVVSHIMLAGKSTSMTTSEYMCLVSVSES